MNIMTLTMDLHDDACSATALPSCLSSLVSLSSASPLSSPLTRVFDVFLYFRSSLSAHFPLVNPSPGLMMVLCVCVCG